MPRRMGRPGLVRTVGRTAVIAGTATAVSGGMQRRRAAKDADQMAAQQQAQPVAAAPPAAAPAPAGEDPIEKVKELAELHSSGVLSDEEFAAAKAKALGI